MKPTITYEEMIETKNTKSIGFVDVRSPKEFQESTIPGAINLPVLDNEVRAEVGTLYVEGHIKEAKQVGVNAIAARLPDMYQEYQKMAEKYDELVIFCSRGGMRSNSIFSLLKALGMPVSRLTGGYKSYRRYIHEHLDASFEKVHFVTLYGPSGSGKTEILKHLADKGAHVLDLEGCANHRGSVLGSVGLDEPHTQKMFESLLFEASQNWQAGDVVFTEGESKRIGKVVMPGQLVEAIRRGKKVYVEAPMERRIAQIRQDYVKEDNQEELAEALEHLNGFFKEERIRQFQEDIRHGEVDRVIESLLVSYYDPKYGHHNVSMDDYVKNLDDAETAKNLLDWQKESEASLNGK